MVLLTAVAFAFVCFKSGTLAAGFGIHHGRLVSPPQHRIQSFRGGAFTWLKESTTASSNVSENTDDAAANEEEPTSESVVVEKKNESQPSSKKSFKSTNPLWPEGISREDIDILVADILDDPSINVPAIPDVLERQIYRSTTILTLNAVYRSVGFLHGKTVLGHEFALARLRREESRAARMRQEQLLRMKSDVDEELLEQVADRLLSNKNINQPLIPDVAERAIYISCLKIVFRILNMLAASFRITVCGHDFTLNLEKAVASRPDMVQAAQTAASSATAIDSKFLRELARETAAVAAGDEKKSLWKRRPTGLIKASTREFVIQLHAVLYCLILGILDDLLANTELVLMSDRIHFDIVAKDATGKQSFLTKAKQKVADRIMKRQQEAEEEDEEETGIEVVEEVSSIATTPERRTRQTSHRVVPFVLGIAVGALGSTIRFMI